MIASEEKMREVGFDSTSLCRLTNEPGYPYAWLHCHAECSEASL